MGLPPFSALKTIAASGAVFTVAAGFMFYWDIQRKLRSGPYYALTQSAIRQNETAMNALGDKYDVGYFKLRDPYNKVNHQEAHLKYILKGSKSSAVVLSDAIRKDDKSWELTRLEFYGGTKENPVRLVIVEGKQENTQGKTPENAYAVTQNAAVPGGLDAKLQTPQPVA
eukprot:comp4574_c0_seq1/m.790 comp4574_c0_seq1/g.790  ORF comp4574_c0_seq1/g.790 comp4574_c0_seq1/m.790 type:complete len:169 (-) comp4574_c0_seq1:59-565(-)